MTVLKTDRAVQKFRIATEIEAWCNKAGLDEATSLFSMKSQTASVIFGRDSLSLGRVICLCISRQI